MKTIKIIAGMFALCCLPILASANAEVEKKLIERISKSQAELQNLQKKITQESAAYANTLDRQQQALKDLREKAAVIRREKDEQLLSLEQLKTRVDQWSSQSNYQQSLLVHYLESTGLINALPGEEKQVKPEALTLIAADITSKLNPAWVNSELITPSGEVVPSQSLQLGAIKLAYNQELDLAGIVAELAGESRLAFVFDSQQKNHIEALSATGTGLVSFDPTLGKAFELIGQNDTLLGHIEKGGAWAIPIVLFGILALIISIVKAIEFIRLPKLHKELGDLLIANKNAPDSFEVKNAIAQAGLPQQQLIDIVKRTLVSQQRDDFMVAYLMEYRHKVERFMNLVSVTASIAALLGLLGAVSGMITTFKMMTIFGTGDASTVSGGISIALITTELGLVVAIPSLIASALLSRKIKSYLHDLESFAIKVSKVNFS
ncbi:MAG: MotA/TolQ/ExbB proton channel family protein [Cellvibrio sp.]|nr:MotA/TolQ/ExbB proton channel family protein [Cellvibrio sp.]